jgi:hypothetical protein
MDNLCFIYSQIQRRKAFNKIIFLKTVLKYAEALLSLDVELELDELKLVADEKELAFIDELDENNFSTEKSFKGKGPPSRASTRSKSRSERKNTAKTQKRRLHKDSKNKNGIKTRIENRNPSKVTETVRNLRLKDKVFSLPDLIGRVTGNRIPENVPKKAEIVTGNHYYNHKWLNGLIFYRKDHDITDAIELYSKKYCNHESLNQNANSLFETAKTFNKTWLGHVNLAVKMAKLNTTRKINTLPHLNTKQV